MDDESDKYSDRELLVSIHTKISMISTTLADHEARIRKAESYGFATRGAIGVLVFISGMIEPFLIWRKK